MSGTSGDGIDTALLRLEGDPHSPKWDLVAFRTEPFPRDLRRSILEAAEGRLAEPGRIAALGVRLGRAYAGAIRELMRESATGPGQLDAIGLHGQTIFHDPDGDPPVTVQIGSPSELAAELGCDVISDFRSSDMAAGGQGAPLVPFADAALLRDRVRGRVALNIGGIANLTWLPPGKGIEGVTGFDTGPGNMVMDGLVDRSTGGELDYDLDGRIASQGRVIPDLLQEWLRHPFFGQTPPRSTGREAFGGDFVQEVWDRWGAKEEAADLIATAAALTVESIAISVERYLPSADSDRQVVVGGGGARNPYLMARLSERIAPSELLTSDRFGLPVDAREAIAFALLAYAFLEGVPANLPAVTGASRPVVLGSLTPGIPEEGGD